MDSLPIEILEHIFIQLSQRNIVSISCVCKRWNEIISQPLFYTTIEIFTFKQLNKCIKMGKEKMISNKPSGSYIQRLKLHIKFLPKDKAIDLLHAFPNIQLINGSDLIITTDNPAIDNYYPLLEKLTHFSLWYTKSNKNWMSTLINNNQNNNDNKYKTKSLEFKITNDDFNSLTVPIQYKSNFGKYSIILNLPTTTLNYLTKLIINFHFDRSTLSRESIIKSDINEYTFESIHQSCPRLESLTICNFIMYTSGEFYSGYFLSDTHHHQKMIPSSPSSSAAAAAHSLKHIKLYGTFTDPTCYTFLSFKYPQLESLELNVRWNYVSKERNLLFASAIQGMMSQFKLLKKLSTQFYQKLESSPHNNINNYEKLEPFCGHYEFLKWLQEHPTQLDDLLFQHYFSNDNKYYELMDCINHDQRSFLNHLTTLSIQMIHATSLVFNYLFQNKNQMIVSFSIKTLHLEGNSYKPVSQYLNIYDWLGLFPNLKSLDLKNFKYIKDYDDNDNEYENDKRYSSIVVDKNANSFWNSRELHILLKQRKQELDIMSNNAVYYYDLECLCIENCDLYLKQGINQLFKRCRYLKNITLDYIHYLPLVEEMTVMNSISSSSSPTEILYLDLSHHYLDYLYIKKFFLSYAIDAKSTPRIITQLKLHETSLNKDSTIGYSKPSCSYTHIHLNLKCNYVDGLLFI